MITIQNVWKSFSDCPVLKGLNLEIPQHAVTVIIGKSGCGKSLLLRHIAGLEEPDSGNVSIDGICVTNTSSQEKHHLFRQVGLLFQHAALFDSMTIEDNVAFALRYRRHRPTEAFIQHEVVDALNKVGLLHAIKSYPADLSGGQQKRAALARLLVYKPKILLFDEPTTGLDPITAQTIVELIKNTQQHLKATVVVVTHDMAAAKALGSYFALHNNGIIEEQGTQESFFASGNQIIQDFLTYGAPFHTSQQGFV